MVRKSGDFQLIREPKPVDIGVKVDIQIVTARNLMPLAALLM